MVWWVVPIAFAMPPPSGLYLLDTEIVTESRVPIFGRNLVNTQTTALVQIAEEEEGLQARQQTCRVVIEDASRATTRIPEAFIRALEPIVYSVTVDGLGFQFEGELQRVGLVDGEIQDTDRDGRPGATIWLDVPLFGQIDVYVTQETASVLRGTYDGVVGTGVVDVTTIRQQTLGASHPLFRISPRLSPVPGRSRFRIERIQEDTTCSDLAEL